LNGLDAFVDPESSEQPVAEENHYHELFAPSFHFDEVCGE